MRILGLSIADRNGIGGVGPIMTTQPSAGAQSPPISGTILLRKWPFRVQTQFMNLADLTSAIAVEKAIAIFDELGRDKFLQTYGFGPATRYLISKNGRKYDSKAIAGVAYGIQLNREPLTPAMFSGGVAKNAAASRLRELGFQIDTITG